MIRRMNVSVATSPRLRSYMPVLIMLGLCLYFSFYLIFGPRGYLALDRLESEFVEQSASYDDLKELRETIEADVKLMRPDHLDADMADEQARRILGYAKPDEIIIPLTTQTN